MPTPLCSIASPQSRARRRGPDRRSTPHWFVLLFLALIYSAEITTDPNWRHALAPLLITAILATPVVSAVAAMGTHKAGALRTLSERH